ncbi:MAG: hypothetical protein ACI310_06470 [Bacilli bacterium]
MKYLSLLEKLKVLLDMLLSFKFILIFVIIMLILTILYLFKKISNKKYIIFMSLSIIITFIISIIKNYKILSNTFDNFATIFFNGIYFPSIYVYIGILLIVSLAFITSVFSSKKRKIYKIINSVMFILNNIFFIIVLNVIAKNNINIFEISSLYTNNSLVAILELNIILFILWIAVLTITYITNTICDKISSKQEVKEVVPVLEQIKEIVPEEEMISSVILPEENISQNTIKENTTISTINESKVTFSDILNGLVPVKYYDNEINSIDYNISNPQEIYENNYNNLKLELEKENTKVLEDIQTIKKAPEVNIIKENNIIENKVNAIEVQTIEEKTKKIKEENMKKNLISNTISLNDLIEQDKEIDMIGKVITTINNPEYTLNDYKKIVEMLKEIKNNSNKNNISIDDAVTMSLINNYSIDDCVKFKEILESNLN